MNDVQFNKYTHLLSHGILSRDYNQLLLLLSRFVVYIYDLEPTPMEHHNCEFTMEKLIFICVLTVQFVVRHIM